MLRPTVSHIAWNVPVDPVKWIPARCGDASTGSPIVAPGPGTMLITPGGRPAASSTSMMTCAEKIAVDAGFHTTVLPISAGAVGRLPAIDVKLKGVAANTKPSSGRCSNRFHDPGADAGCSR